MSLRRLPRLLVTCIFFALTVAMTGCASETPAEHAANVYAAQELAAAPPHSNLPDYSLSPSDLAKAQHLSTVHETLHFGNEAWGILSLLLLLSFGAIAWMRDTAVKVSSNRRAQGFVFLLLYLLAGTLLSLPCRALRPASLPPATDSPYKAGQAGLATWPRPSRSPGPSAASS